MKHVFSGNHIGYGFLSVMMFAIGITVFPVLSKDVRVTVQDGSTHTFWGFGGNTVSRGRALQQVNVVSEAVRDSMAKMVWGDLDFRVMRLWPQFHEATAANYSAALAPLINAARAHQDSLILLLAPFNWGTIDTNNTLAFSVTVAQFIKDLKDSHDQ